MKKKKDNKKSKKIVLLINIVVLILINVVFWEIDRSGIIYTKQKKIITNYIEEKYDIKPDINSVTRLNKVDNHEYVYYVSMDIDGNSFYAYIYDDGNITDEYMQVKLGKEIYKEVKESIEKEFNTKLLYLPERTSTYLSYQNNDPIPANMTVNELLNSNSKLSLSIGFVIKNTKSSDLDIINQLYSWINNYAKAKGIDYLSVYINFIDEENCKTVIKNQDDSDYIKRYLYVSDLDLSSVSLDDLKGTIYTTTDYEYYITPLKED